jgi:hypothetical protein
VGETNRARHSRADRVSSRVRARSRPFAENPDRRRDRTTRVASQDPRRSRPAESRNPTEERLQPDNETGHLFPAETAELVERAALRSGETPGPTPGSEGPEQARLHHPRFTTLVGIRNAPGIPVSRVASFAPCAAARSSRWASVVRDAEEHQSGN